MTQRLKFQFQLDYRPAAPLRDTWLQAAYDAHEAGYAEWVYNGGKMPCSAKRATIERLYVNICDS